MQVVCCLSCWLRLVRRATRAYLLSERSHREPLRTPCRTPMTNSHRSPIVLPDARQYLATQCNTPLSVHPSCHRWYEDHKWWRPHGSEPKIEGSPPCTACCHLRQKRLSWFVPETFL